MPLNFDSFRQWSTWIMLTLTIIAAAVYFGLIYAHHAATGQWMPPAVPIIATIIIFILGATIGHIFAALLNHKTVSAAADEREIYAAMQAEQVSGRILGLCLILSLGTGAVVQSFDILFHLCVASLFAAQIAEYALSLRGTYIPRRLREEA